MDPIYSFGDKPLVKTQTALPNREGQSLPFGDRPVAKQPLPFGDKPIVKQAIPFGDKPLTKEPEQDLSLFEFDKTIKSFKNGIIAEDIVNSPTLMSGIREEMKARSGTEGFVGAAKAKALYALGGVPVNNIDKMNNSDLFEMWQDVHRSYAAGQTVTTLNEAQLISGADDKTKARIAAGYELFDAMDNAFTGRGTWGESFDSLKDNLEAVIWDPTTAVGFGIGRVYSKGGAKAASLGLKTVVQESFEMVLKRELSAGATKTAAEATAKAAASSIARKGFMKIGMKKAAVTASPDIVANVGLDAVQQNNAMTLGLQNDFSYSESALAAAGAVVLPAIAGATKLSSKAVSSLFKGTKYEGTFSAYKELENVFAGKSRIEITESIQKRVDINKVSSDMQRTFSDFKDNLTNYLPWEGAKIEAGKILHESGVPISVDDTNKLFWHTFIYGDSKGKQKGFIESLHDAGFIYYQRDPTDVISNWLGDAMSWIPDDVVKKITTDFEGKMGVKLNVGETGKEFSSLYKESLSAAGSLFAGSSYAKRLLTEVAAKKPAMSRLLKGLGEADKEIPHAKYLGYTQSVWKRVMTSAPATVATNVKGWKSSFLLNGYADLVNGTLLYPIRAAYYGAKGDTLMAKQMVQEGKGTLLGLLRRGYSLLNYDDTLDKAENYFTHFPEVGKALHQTMGDVDAIGSQLKRYNLSEKNKGLKFVESSVENIQKYTGTLLQDEVTKNLSFMTAMDQNILKEYGMSYNDFISKFGKDAFIQMHSDRWVTKVVAPALDRAQRETASKSWSNKSGAATMLNFAKTVEKFSSDPVFGYVIPFGRFFNTSVAFFGDTTGINAIRHVTKKMRGLDIDVAQESGQELLAKGIAGWMGLAYFGMKGAEKIQNGMSWNQVRDEKSGLIIDKTYDQPEATYHQLGQVIGHWMLDDDVPANLVEEVIATQVGQTFRATQDSVKMMHDFVKKVLSGDADEALSASKDILVASASNILSGTTRFLDPINQAAMVVTGDYSTPDRRQGYRFWNESFRYLDKIPGLFGAEDTRNPRYSAVQDKVLQDVGKSFGERKMPENSPFNMMLNSVGSRDWQEVTWEGNPEVKNRMDQLVYPQLNALASKVFETYPDFFDKPLAWRQVRVKEVASAAKSYAEEILNQGVGNDAGLKLLKEISSIPKVNVKRALDYLGIKEDPVDIVALDGGPEKLKTLIYLAKDWDKIMYDAK